MPASRRAPDSDELLEVLRPAFVGRRITALARWPHDHATSYALEELQVSLDDGSSVELMFKDLAWDQLLEVAARTKPQFLYEPCRSVEIHSRVLAPEGIGPRCYVATANRDSGRYWLILERVPGSRLSKIAHFGAWEAVADWLARFHARFADRVAELRTANPFLLDYGTDLYLTWCERARDGLRDSDDPRARRLLRLLEGYEESAAALDALPNTLIHGDFYAGNVLIDGAASDLRICPVDWEVAGTGPGLLDLAALTAGRWHAMQRGRLFGAYRAALLGLGADVPPMTEMSMAFDRCRLHFALQWLGWSPGYEAPPGIKQDWLGEAIDLADRLGM
jgi:aminoglycoside phosphotransferase (APT) family kinase protein